jgi:hypothetical protein
MKALGVGPDLLEAPPHPHARLYGRFFVAEAAHHPYAILGAKGVLEHFSVRTADDLVRGVLASGIPNAANATRFIRAHGTLDIDHVREGDRNLGALGSPTKRLQVVDGAYFASGTYRALVRSVVTA